MSKRKRNPPRHKQATAKFTFDSGAAETTQLAEITAKLILQFAQMAESESPKLRAEGRDKIMRVAEFCVAGQFFLADQHGKAATTPRATIETDEEKGTSLAGIVRKLDSQTDALGEPLEAKVLWPKYIAELDQLGLNPRENNSGVLFGGEDGKQKSTSKASFRATLNRERKKKKKK